MSLLKELRLPFNESMSYKIIMGNGHIKAIVTVKMLLCNIKD